MPTLPQFPTLRTFPAPSSAAVRTLVRQLQGRTVLLGLAAAASLALLAPACAVIRPLTAPVRDAASNALSAQTSGSATGGSATNNSRAVPPATPVASAQKQQFGESASLAAPAAVDRAVQSAPAAAGVAAPNTAAGAAQAQQALPPLPANDRLVIKNAALTLQVSDLAAAVQRVNAAVQAIPGAYVAASNTSYRAETVEKPATPVPADRTIAPVPPGRPVPAQSASLTLKVPVDAFGSLLNSLREAGTPLGENVSTQEVTEEFVDLEAQVRNLEATEQQYQRLMERAQKIEEILPLQQRLSDVRSQIERLRGRMNLLQRRADLSTITVTLVLPTSRAETAVPGEPRLVRTLRTAFAHLGTTLAGFADVAIYLLVYALPLAPFAVAYWWWRRGRRPAMAGAPAVGAM